MPADVKYVLIALRMCPKCALITDVCQTEYDECVFMEFRRCITIHLQPTGYSLNLFFNDFKISVHSRKKLIRVARSVFYQKSSHALFHPCTVRKYFFSLGFKKSSSFK